MRILFAFVLTTCYPSKPDALWEKYKNSMNVDILYALRTVNHNPDLEFTSEIYEYNEALVKIEDLCMFISNDPLINLGMPSPTRPASDLFNGELQREQLYDVDQLNEYVQTNKTKLVSEQKAFTIKLCMQSLLRKVVSSSWMRLVEQEKLF